MSKYVIGENKEMFDIEDALTISKGEWADGNANSENRLHRFVTANNEGNKVELANADSYVCGVTVQNDSFLGEDRNNATYCVVQSLGICEVEDNGKLFEGDKCMPGEDGKATISTNNLGYRVVGRVDDSHVQIIMSPNNDMIQRIKEDKQSKLGQGTYSGKLDDISPKESSVYWCSGCSDRPNLSLNYGWCITLSIGTNCCTQLYKPYSANPNKNLYMRYYANAKWYDWTNVVSKYEDITSQCKFPTNLWKTNPRVDKTDNQLVISFSAQIKTSKSGVTTLLTLPEGIVPFGTLYGYVLVDGEMATIGAVKSTREIKFANSRNVVADKYVRGQFIVPLG